MLDIIFSILFVPEGAKKTLGSYRLVGALYLYMDNDSAPSKVFWEYRVGITNGSLRVQVSFR